MQLNLSPQMQVRLNQTLPALTALGNHHASRSAAEPLVFQFVPLERIGALVQDCLRAGMKKVSVVTNRGGSSCTLTLER